MIRQLLIPALTFSWLFVPSLHVQADEKPRMLFLTQSEGFVHRPVKRAEGERAPAELAMMQLAKDSGKFTVTCSQNAAADITKANLQNYDIVAFYTSGNLPIADENLEYFLGDWLRQKGHGFIGFHSATDTYKDFEPYWDMVGGTFNGHPWGQSSTVTLTVHDPDHPCMKPYEPSFAFQDEIYQYAHWQPAKVHVLMSLDMEHTEIKRPYHVPVAWCKQLGEGKMYYNNLGHREKTWHDERFLESIVAAVRWIDGQIEANAQPNPEVSAKHHEESVRHAHAAGITLEKLEAERKAREARNAARRAAQAKRRAEQQQQ